MLSIFRVLKKVSLSFNNIYQPNPSYVKVHASTGAWVLPMWRENPHSSKCHPHADRKFRTNAGVMISHDKV